MHAPILTPEERAKKKDEFLACLEECGTIELAAKSIGMSRTSIYDWQKADPEFKDKVRELQMQAEDTLLDTLYTRARANLQGDNPQEQGVGVRAVELHLRANGKLTEHADINLNHTGKVHIKLNWGAEDDEVDNGESDD